MYRHWKANIEILREVPSPLQWYTNYDMNVLAAILEKNKQTAIYDRATEMRLRRRYVKLAQRSGDMELSLYGREVDTLVEGVDQFKYLGRILDQYNGYCTEICQNIMRAQNVWGYLGNIF